MPVALRANALVTLPVAKEYVGIALANTTFDDKISRMINRASAACESITKRRLVTQAYVRKFDGTRQDRILLHQWPIVSVAYVKVGGTVQDASTYDFDEVSIVSLGGVFPRGNRNLEVSFEAGVGTLADDDIPADLEEACLELVAWYYQGVSNDRVGVKSRGKSGEITTYETEIPSHVKLLLAPYERHELPFGEAITENG